MAYACSSVLSPTITRRDDRLTQVSFYHLQRQPLERALPQLLGKALAADLRAVVLAGSRERVDALNNSLWTYDPGSFLPHGGPDDGAAEEHPVYLTTNDENPNEASVLVLVDGAQSARLENFDRCLDIFDGNDETAVEAARGRWKTCKEGGHEVTYWRQSEAGKWEQKSG